MSIVDLFSGCGGLALGARQAGLRTHLAIDIDPILTSSFAINFPGTRLVHADISALDRSQLETLLPSNVTGILGGPPCQAFSEMGRRSDADPRRSLVHEFFRVVSIVRPAFFLMENVRGLGYAPNRPLLDAGIDMLDGTWDIVGPVLLDASNFGAPTKRIRLFVFGFDRNKMNLPSLGALTATCQTKTNVRDAITDLSAATYVGRDRTGAERWAYGNNELLSAYASRMVSPAGGFTGHQETVHAPETRARFSKLGQGEFDSVGKHRRLSWEGLCPTLRAGTGADRGSYQSVRPIHPAEDRVITPREAARLQGFPDWFEFHRTTWHSFRMIGNSVSPIAAAALLSNIRTHLNLKNPN